MKDESVELYFAMGDSDVDHLEATAVSAEFLNPLMSRSASRRIVLLLDCCYAGAFGRAAARPSHPTSVRVVHAIRRCGPGSARL